MTPSEVRTAVSKLVEEETTPLSRVEKERVTEEVLNEVFGLGPREPLLQDPTISDILVTTPKLVYVERGGKLQRTPVEFKELTGLTRKFIIPLMEYFDLTKLTIRSGDGRLLREKEAK